MTPETFDTLANHGLKGIALLALYIFWKIAIRGFDLWKDIASGRDAHEHEQRTRELAQAAELRTAIDKNTLATLEMSACVRELSSRTEGLYDRMFDLLQKKAG